MVGTGVLFGHLTTITWHGPHYPEGQESLATRAWALLLYDDFGQIADHCFFISEVGTIMVSLPGLL